MQNARRIALTVAGLILAVYLVACAALVFVLRLPPEKLGRTLNTLPGVTRMTLPFLPLWMWARAGRLQPGDLAPDFDLQTADHKARVRLSDFRGKQPVLLVFGSYT